MGNPSDEAVLARHRPRLDKCLDGLDKALASMPYMGGGEFSLVDIVYMPGVYVAAKYVNVFVGRENLKRWWERVSVREGWKKAIEPVDETWARIVPGWKGKGQRQGEGKGGEEDEGKRANL
jgi:glutathione S-transferase